MDSIVYKIDLDCRRSESQAKIEAKCGEASGRKIIFSLYEGRSPYVVPNGVIAVFRAKKPSGAVLFNNCAITDDGNVEYVITTQTVAEVGIMPCELQLIQGGKVIFSPCFTMVVVNNLAIDSEVESSDEFTELVEALERVPSGDNIVEYDENDDVTLRRNLTVPMYLTLTYDNDEEDGIGAFATNEVTDGELSKPILHIGQLSDSEDAVIRGVAAPVGNNDAANKKYVNDVGLSLLDYTDNLMGVIDEGLTKAKADISDLDTRVTYLEEHGGGGESYDDTELRQRIGAIEAKESTWDAKSNFSGNYNDLTNKPTIPTVPTNVSAFTNDSGYLTLATLPVYGGEVV